MITHALDQSKGNVAGAARLLGISRQLLGHKITKQGLRPLLADIKYKLM